MRGYSSPHPAQPCDVLPVSRVTAAMISCLLATEHVLLLPAAPLAALPHRHGKTQKPKSVNIMQAPEIPGDEEDVDDDDLEEAVHVIHAMQP
ncbi:hypothetical protein NDU88_002187 [Pleurodeles waltl]|uniref:Uncharacterized protein n=1 Tax=Pleurodeles waltl TaxID=8319 RepID=A0AAV7UBL5_PLEWA|nr:hypothetical protein NDU88_002187 [Pleurodeles waltl]